MVMLPSETCTEWHSVDAGRSFDDLEGVGRVEARGGFGHLAGRPDGLSGSRRHRIASGTGRQANVLVARSAV